MAKKIKNEQLKNISGGANQEHKGIQATQSHYCPKCKQGRSNSEVYSEEGYVKCSVCHEILGYFVADD